MSNDATGVKIWLTNGDVDGYDDSMSEVGGKFVVLADGTGVCVSFNGVDHLYPIRSIHKHEIYYR